ncbi:hypothetical protein, partial [Rhodonellum psychrophilum]|uniref:hypothetical protein n=1 Tax=Rhodonellum psychrophilum TaxID=336828 RepID=UPI001F1F5B5A
FFTLSESCQKPLIYRPPIPPEEVRFQNIVSSITPLFACSGPVKFPPTHDRKMFGGENCKS